MIKINKEYIKQFNPCKDRWENYLKHYSDFNGSVVDFLKLDKITWEDKKWILFHDRQTILPDKLLRKFAFICASRVVDNCKIQEIKDYFTLILFIYESEDLDLLDSGEYRAAGRAAYTAADSAADWVAYRAAYWAAERVAERVAEENIQCEILINLVEEFSERPLSKE